MAAEKYTPPTIKLQNLEYPDIAFSKGAPSEPATSETTGNVTVNNAAQPGSPAYFDVAMNIPITTTWNDVDVQGTVFLRLPVPSKGDLTPYREVCQAGLEQLAPLFRSLADQIEQELEGVSKAKAVKDTE